jgi:hypothetical protein
VTPATATPRSPAHLLLPLRQAILIQLPCSRSCRSA